MPGAAVGWRVGSAGLGSAAAGTPAEATANGVTATAVGGCRVGVSVGGREGAAVGEGSRVAGWLVASADEAMVGATGAAVAGTREGVGVGRTTVTNPRTTASMVLSGVGCGGTVGIGWARALTPQPAASKRITSPHKPDSHRRSPVLLVLRHVGSHFDIERVSYLGVRVGMRSDVPTTRASGPGRWSLFASKICRQSLASP